MKKTNKLCTGLTFQIREIILFSNREAVKRRKKIKMEHRFSISALYYVVFEKVLDWIHKYVWEIFIACVGSWLNHLQLFYLTSDTFSKNVTMLYDPLTDIIVKYKSTGTTALAWFCIYISPLREFENLTLP